MYIYEQLNATRKLTSSRLKIFTKSLIIRSCNELDHETLHEDPWGFNKVVNFSFGKANMKFCSNNWRDWGSLKGLSFHITVLALCQDVLNNNVDGGYALLNKNKKLITIKHSSHLRILNHLIELLIICLFQQKSNKDENSWWNGRYGTVRISMKKKFIGDDHDVCIYLIGYKPLKRLIGVLISSDFKRKVNSEGYIDVGDGCWRRNVLVTSLRCWWPI